MSNFLTLRRRVWFLCIPLLCWTVQSAYSQANANGTYTVPIYPNVELGSGNDLLIYASVNGGALEPYILDSGAPNLYATYGAWWGSGALTSVVTGMYSDSFDSGNDLVYNGTAVSIALGGSSQVIVNSGTVNIAMITQSSIVTSSGTVTGNYTTWTANVASGTTPLPNGSFGDFGVGLYGNKSVSGLAELLGQIPVGPSDKAGFMINTNGNLNAAGSLTVGLSPGVVSLFSSPQAVVMTMGTSTSTVPGPNGTTLPAYGEAQAPDTTVTVVTSSGSTVTEQLATIFDSGGRNNSYILSGTTNLSNYTGSAQSFLVTSNGQTVVQYTGTTPLGGGLGVDGGGNHDPRTNTGLSVFYEDLVIFDISDGLVVILPYTALNSLPYLDNSITSTTSNFTVSGPVTTSQAPVTVNSLTFSNTSSLTVTSALTVTSGSFTVPSGTGTITGGIVNVPGNFTGNGAGVLNAFSIFSVAGSANILGGGLNIGSIFGINGALSLNNGSILNVFPSGILAAGGSANLSGLLDIQSGGIAAFAGGVNLNSGAELEIDGGGSLVSAGSANVNGLFDIQGRAAMAGGLNIGSGGETEINPGGFLSVGLNASVNGLFDIQSGGQATVAGTTTVNSGGTLTVDGALASQQGVLVAQSGLLNGGGVIVGSVSNNGTVLPGDDPATLTVAGNYTQSGSGTLNIEVASPGDHGVLAVGGAASLNGTLLVTPFNNFQFALGQVIPNFLTAGSVSGSFSTVSVNDRGFRGRVLENGGDLSLLIAPSSYTQVAKNGNQYNVAKALNGFIPVTSGDRETVSTTLDFLTASQYPAAFNAIMPDFYQTVTSIGLSLATTEGQIVDQRLSAIRMSSSGFAMQGVGNMPVYNEKGGDGKSTMDGKRDIISPAPDNNWGIWVQGNGIFGHSYSISDVPNYNFESGGFLVGGDYRWNKHFSTGVFTGYQGAYGNYPNGGKVWTNGADFGAYVTYDSGNGFHANAILMGAYTNYRVDRPIDFSTINRMANSTPGGGDFATFLEAGYDFKTGGLTYGPLANAQYTWLGVAPFTERNAGSLDLSMGSENLNSLQTNLGGHVAYTFILPNKYEIIPDLRLFWNHEFLQNPTGIGASLNGGGGPGFTYDTATPSRDSAYAGLGINAQLGSRWSIGAYYNIDFGGYTSITHIVSANLGFSW